MKITYIGGIEKEIKIHSGAEITRVEMALQDITRGGTSLTTLPILLSVKNSKEVDEYLFLDKILHIVYDDDEEWS